MKCKTVVDKIREEEVIIYVHQSSRLSDDIENYVRARSEELFGFDDKNAVKLNRSEIFCFTVENDRVYAYTEKERFLIKRRLYEVEETLDGGFVKINQSCIVNVEKILRFDASFSGTLSVTLKNGYKDYVSRRQIKKVKERIGV